MARPAGIDASLPSPLVQNDPFISENEKTVKSACFADATRMAQ